jgi:Ca2+/H+ antiporter
MIRRCVCVFYQNHPSCFWPSNSPDHGIVVLGAPPALGGVLIALIVITPEAIVALRAALANQLQQSINLSLGASASTIGLTVPAILGVGLVTGKAMVPGLDPTGMTLLALTLVLSRSLSPDRAQPFSRGRCAWWSSSSTLS